MDALIAAYSARLQALHDEMDKTLAGLPAEALAWSPGAEMNGMALLAVHVAGAERYMIGDLLGGDPSGRDRDQEFATQGGDAEELRGQLAAVLAHSLPVLARLTPEDLTRVVYSRIHQREFDGAYVLLRALDHIAEHVGHMQMTRQLWSQRDRQ